MRNQGDSGTYERPYTRRQMLAAGYAPALVRKLMADPVHAWRAKTGVELIHKEPDLEEAIRVWVNWNRMSATDKAKSDRKSKRMFGVDNKTHYEQLRPAYATKKAGLLTVGGRLLWRLAPAAGKAGGKALQASEALPVVQAVCRRGYIPSPGELNALATLTSGREALSTLTDWLKRLRPAVKQAAATDEILAKAKTHYEQLRPAYATKEAALVTAVPLISAIIRSIRADPGSPDRTINLPEVLREMVHLDRAVDQSKVASAAGWRPSDALAVRRMPPARTTYVSATRPRPPAPRHTLRSWDAGAKFRPPSWSAEARLHQAGETAIGGLATGMSVPLSATLGGLHGVTNGVRSGSGAVGTALQGLVGAGTAFIPGRAGVANTAGGGGIEGIAGDIISGKM